MSNRKWKIIQRPSPKRTKFLQLAHAVVKAGENGKAIKVGFVPMSTEYGRLARYLRNHHPPLGIRSQELESGRYAVWSSKEIMRKQKEKKKNTGSGLHTPIVKLKYSNE